MALEPAETLALHVSRFEVLRRRDPLVDRILIMALTRGVRRLDDRLMEALYESAGVRVVRRLLERIAVYEEAGGTVVPRTQDDLASMAGTSGATVNRVLGVAQEAGAIELRRGRIDILEPAPLGRRGR